MNRKLAEDLIHSNAEYTKLRGRLTDGAPAPESRGSQAPGARGLERPDLEAWTTEELRRAATTLGIEGPQPLRREELIEALLAAELAAVTGSRGRR